MGGGEHTEKPFTRFPYKGLPDGSYQVESIIPIRLNENLISESRGRELGSSAADLASVTLPRQKPYDHQTKMFDALRVTVPLLLEKDARARLCIIRCWILGLDDEARKDLASPSPFRRGLGGFEDWNVKRKDWKLKNEQIYLLRMRTLYKVRGQRF